MGTSAITCDIIRLIESSTLAEGKVIQVNINNDETNRCELLVERLCDPNPYNIKLNDKLQFKAPGIDIQIDQVIECIPTAKDVGALIEVLKKE